MAWRQTLFTMIVAVLAALLVRQFLITAYRVPTGSMQPTLKPGDFIFSYRRAYGWVGEPSLPRRGDLVIFSYPQQPRINYVKRVIALPGDRLEMAENRLILNGRPLEYADVIGADDDNPQPELFTLIEERMEDRAWRLVVEKSSQSKSFGPLVIPPGEVFLLGDNRDTSDDSRYWGTVPVGRITGRAWLVWMSLAWERPLAGTQIPRVRWSRVLMPLD